VTLSAPPVAWWGLVKLVATLLMAFAMILAVGFLLIVSLVTSAILAAMGRRLDPVFGGRQAVPEAGNAIGGFLLAAFMFGLIDKAKPRQHRPERPRFANCLRMACNSRRQALALLLLRQIQEHPDAARSVGVQVPFQVDDRALAAVPRRFVQSLKRFASEIISAMDAVVSGVRRDGRPLGPHPHDAA